MGLPAKQFQVTGNEISSDVLQQIKVLSFRIEEKTRRERDEKYAGMTTTDIYRKLAREILGRNGPMDIRELFKLIVESGRISDDVILPYFINNIVLDPNAEVFLKITQEGNKAIVALK